MIKVELIILFVFIILLTVKLFVVIKEVLFILLVIILNEFKVSVRVMLVPLNLFVTINILVLILDEIKFLIFPLDEIKLFALIVDRTFKF